MSEFEWDPWYEKEDLESRPLTKEELKKFKLYIMQQNWRAECPTYVYRNHKLKSCKKKNNLLIKKKQR